MVALSLTELISCSPLGWGFQYASFHIFIMENKVTMLTQMAMPVTTKWPDSKPLVIRKSLPKKPDRGGTPARAMAGKKKSNPSQGWFLNNPDRKSVV